MRAFTFAIAVASLLLTSPSHAQNPNAPAIEACRTTGLIALKERSSSLKDLIFDMETLAVTKANTTVEGTPIKTVVYGRGLNEKRRTTPIASSA